MRPCIRVSRMRFKEIRGMVFFFFNDFLVLTDYVVLVPFMPFFFANTLICIFFFAFCLFAFSHNIFSFGIFFFNIHMFLVFFFWIHFPFLSSVTLYTSFRILFVSFF
ncbi:hypothetical protein BC829DRAFT_378709, partial [Chytridium lagenaria]